MDYVGYVTMHNGSWHVNAVGQLSFDLDGSDWFLPSTNSMIPPFIDYSTNPNGGFDRKNSAG